MTGKTLEMCQKLLVSMMDDIKAPPFNTPVDPDKLGIPEYRVIIKNPMDLGTIKSHLAKSRTRYKTLRDFASKVRLVFDNARTFNQSGSPIYNDADYLAKLFESKYAELQKILGLPKSYDPPKEFQLPPLPPVALPLDSPITRRATRDGTQDSKRKRKSQASSKVTQKPPKTKKTENITTPSSSQTVSLSEKRELHEVLISLSDNEWVMGKLMEIISPASTSTGTGELEIDVANLPVTTFRKLQRFIKEHTEATLKTTDLEEDYDDPNYNTMYTL